MAPTRPRTRSSVGSSSPSKNAMAEVVPLRSGSPTAHPRSPIKKRTPGTITMQQKQAMIDNMQLEITERARRLRAQYNYMATTVRSRIEMRLNRIPMSMRNVKMGDLLQKYMEQEKQRAARSAVTRKPPTTARITSPVKHSQPSAHNFKPSTRTKRMSDAISGDKENEIEHNENAKKKVRGIPNGDMSLMRPAQVLSPTSSNSRMANRPVSPIKSGIARPASPLKNPSQSRSAAAANMLTSMVEKAKASRGGVARKVTTSSTISTNSNTVAVAKNKKVPANATSRPPVSRPATRTGRRSIANSESSETSNGTVIRKASGAKGAPAKKGATASRKGAATGGVRKTTAAKANTSTASTGTGRVLRKRA
ncbi:nbl1 borealin protein [Fusarium flagelliforme]|uniref:Nbl1 borealin protein n=1 Tax=Fusarium flagelliforme TaxID=2675880 RepID=A0A395MYA3_9HYPO|nr:nbl1 borealin protein [Fusarium flagelliforme]